jgi:hypothetical protein
VVKAISELQKDQGSVAQQPQGAATQAGIAAPTGNASQTTSSAAASSTSTNATSTTASGFSLQPGQSVGGYNDQLTLKHWATDEQAYRWNINPQRRLAIRTFSRGLLGAAAFAWGGWAISGEPHGGGWISKYDKDRNMSGIWKEYGLSRPLQYVARTVDVMFGKPIEFMAKALGAENPERWVKFRQTSRPSEHGHGGRTLGEEVVGITFDFFSASIGDALGRDIVDNLDPHFKKKIWKDEEGHNSFTATLKNTGRTLWRYLSYNGGEDWAVAVPYAYFIRAQRKLINHLSPGWKYDVDRSINGASFKVNHEGHITGSYNLEGLIDLQTRFTIYNIGTLGYRELYNHIDNVIHGRPSSLYGTPEDKNKHPHGLIDQASDIGKWAVRTFFKGGLYMTASVPFFSIFRTSQSKYKGVFINPETEGILSYRVAGANGKYKDEVLHVNELDRSGNPYRIDDARPNVFFDKFSESRQNYVAIDPRTGAKLTDPHMIKSPIPFDPYTRSHGVLGRGFDKIGKAQNTVRSQFNDLPETHSAFHKIGKRDMDRYINAAFAYTPYMYMKAETAMLWDNGKTDTALERMIDGASRFNFKEFKAGLGEFGRAIMHQPFADPKREAEAQHRMKSDTSAADGAAYVSAKEVSRRTAAASATPKVAATTTTTTTGTGQEAAQHAALSFTTNTSSSLGAVKSGAQARSTDNLPWHERVVQGRKDEVKTEHAADAPRAAASAVQAAGGHAEKERMREFLAQATTLTPSIN